MAPFSRIPRAALPALVLLTLVACGGGGSGGDRSPPAPPPVNQVPQLVSANGNQVAVQFHDFDYDAAQGGHAFVDPDGDRLSYEVTFAGNANGLRANGGRVLGRPQTLDTVMVTIVARDPRGGAAVNVFYVSVNPNGAPAAAGDRQDKLVQVGEPFALDATRFGTPLSDPEGDVLQYRVSLRGAPGAMVSGTEVRGALASVGAIEVTVTGTDPFGASADNVFVIAAPAAEPGAPTLPATPFIYSDEALPLPDDFRTSSEIRIPLWDTQPPDNRTTDAGAALGRVLFHDKRLSITNTLACASCHRREHGFASPERFDRGAIGVPLTRNSMALANARYNTHGSWFLDLRVLSIRDAARQAMTRPEELGHTLPAIVAKLQAAGFYAPLFEAAFGTPEIDPDRVLRALEQYVQALISYRAKYDVACDTVGGVLKDCAAGLTAQEARGREIFTDGSTHFTCGHCHSLPSGSTRRAWRGYCGWMRTIGVRSP
jgi:hypothetical protein